jgi:hypothetical protein
MNLPPNSFLLKAFILLPVALHSSLAGNACKLWCRTPRPSLSRNLCAPELLPWAPSGFQVSSCCPSLTKTEQSVATGYNPASCDAMAFEMVFNHMHALTLMQSKQQ